MSPRMCVESEYGWIFCKNFKMSLAFKSWLYFQQFNPFFPFLICKLLPNTIRVWTNCKPLKFNQQNQQGFPGIRNSSINLLKTYLEESNKWAHMLCTANKYPTHEPPHFLSLQDAYVECNALVECFSSSKPSFWSVKFKFQSQPIGLQNTAQ